MAVRFGESVQGTQNETAYAFELGFDAPERSKNLEILSEELQRRTREAQELQEQVEHATKCTMERMGHSLGSATPRVQKNITHHSMGIRKEVSVPEVHISDLDFRINAKMNEQNLHEATRSIELSGKDLANDYSPQLSELQHHLTTTHALHEQQNHHLRECIIQLQSKLQDSQMEMDALMDQREKEASNQTLQEVCSALLDYEKRGAKRTYMDHFSASAGHYCLGKVVDMVLRDLERENASLKEKLLSVAALEVQLAQALSNCEETHKQREIYRQQAEDAGSLFAKLTMELNKTQKELTLEKEKNRGLREQEKGHSLALEGLRQELNERSLGVLELENMVDSLKDECRILMEKQSSAEKQQSKMQENAARLRRELKAARDQLAEQQQKRERNIKEERAREDKRLLSLQQEQQYKVKILQGLLQEQSLEVQRLQGLLQVQEHEVKRLHVLTEEHDCERKRLNDLLVAEQGEEKRLRGMLDTLEQKMETLKQKEQTFQGLLEEKDRDAGVLRGLLEEKHQEEKSLHDLLEEQKREQDRLKNLLGDKEQELKMKEHNLQQDQAQLQVAQGHAQVLMAEGEALRLKLEESEKMVELLQLQMNGMTQLSLQHSHSIEVLQEERERLASEIDKYQHEIHRMKQVGWEQQDYKLRALELEQSQQKGAVCEKNRSLHELTLQKQQLTMELELLRVQLLSLTGEHEALKKTHISKIQELEGTAVKLTDQLQAVQADLFQAQSTLRSLEEADEHGMKAALGMQRRITAKREQIDTLQGRIQLMEETTDKLTKDKRRQVAECKRLSKELASVSEEKKQLQSEVQALRYLESQLGGKVGKLQAALDKMSEKFSECQDFIQQQEQQFMRLKLQHALDCKDPQGHNWRASGNLQLSSKHNPFVPTHLQHSTKPVHKQDNPVMELKALVKELRSVIDMDDLSSPICRIELPKDDMSSTAATRKTASSRDPLILRTTNLVEDDINSTFSSDGHELSFTGLLRYNSSPLGTPVGRRSPVHSLLTSSPFSSSSTKIQLYHGGPFPHINTTLDGPKISSSSRE
ncbi:hypothetical protein GJAV_G00028390 [Gymnothorax javanicus]|nr:hypothetical protein GJAV_G00028390 [Gymnothorax javanicus]